jgi:hypothetical protein
LRASAHDDVAVADAARVADTQCSSRTEHLPILAASTTPPVVVALPLTAIIFIVDILSLEFCQLQSSFAFRSFWRVSFASGIAFLSGSSIRYCFNMAI